MTALKHGLRAATIAALACGLVACRAVPPEARLTLAAQATGRTRLVVAVTPARRLQGLAATWQTTDIHTFEVSLAPVPPAPAEGPSPEASSPPPGEPAPEASPTPEAPASRTLTLVQRPGQVREAVFDDLPEGWCYEARVRALGSRGGLAPERCLNERTPAVGRIDLRAPGASRRLELTVQLDPTTFSATVELPSSAPSWTTRLEATLQDAGASGDPIATAAWLPGQRARFVNVRGDHDYDLAVSFHSPAGQRTVSLPGFRIPRLGGQADTVTPEVPAPAPPTGTILANGTYPTDGAFMGAFDPAGRCWLTHQKSNRVSVRGSDLQPLLQEIGVGAEPRGIAIDPLNGQVWVANFKGNSVSKIDSNGVVRGTYPAGWYPGGIGVDGQHRVWVASAFFGTVKVMNPDGTEVAGSPFYSGSQPTALSIDPTSEAVWVSNKGSRTITKFDSTGEVVGTFGGGFEPGGIAIGQDHTAWVVDAANNRIWRFAEDGAVLGDPIPVGAGPAGIALNPATGEVWVGIMNGEQVTRLAADGTVLGTYAAGAFPGTLAIEATGHVWVVGGSAVSRLAP